MYIQPCAVARDALAQTKAQGKDRDVLTAILLYWPNMKPSQLSIARIANIPRNNVSRHTGRLRALGELQWTRGAGNQCRYTVNLPAVEAADQLHHLDDARSKSKSNKSVERRERLKNRKRNKPRRDLVHHLDDATEQLPAEPKPPKVQEQHHQSRADRCAQLGLPADASITEIQQALRAESH